MLSILLILNPRAGSVRSAEDAQQIEAVLRSGGNPVRVLRPQDAEELRSVAAQAANAPEDIVVATGGDGTISLIASHLASTAKRLGVIPGGTLNHFAKDLKIPTDLSEAARTVLSGRTIEVDVAEVNGRAFINNSSLGFYPAFVRFREAEQQALGRKWLAIVPAFLRALQQHISLHVQLSVDGRHLSRSTPVVFIGNNEYCAEGLNIGSRETLEDGKLCLVVAKPQGTWQLLLVLVAAILGKVRESSELDLTSATEITVECGRKKLLVALDGEVTTLESPLRYTIRPKALRVIVPGEPRENELAS